MAVTPSKAVTDRQKSSLKVQATREQLPAVGEGLAENLPRPVRAAARGAVELLGGFVIDWLGRSTEEMVKADIANAEENGDDAAYRARRDALTGTVRSVLVDLRDVLMAFFGPSVLKPFGIEGITASDPVVVQRAGLAVLKQLKSFQPPPARRPSMQFVPAEWVEMLERPVAELAEALEEVARDQRQNQLTLGEKNRAIEEYDRTFSRVANLLTALFAAAGRDDLASRVRPSTRRSGLTEEDAPQILGEDAA